MYIAPSGAEKLRTGIAGNGHVSFPAIELIAFGLGCYTDLAPEQAIGDNKVDCCQNHADDPPHQTHLLTIERC